MATITIFGFVFVIYLNCVIINWCGVKASKYLLNLLVWLRYHRIEHPAEQLN